MNESKGLTWQFQRSRAQYLLLTGITVVAFTLRFYQLGTWSFWIDEVLTLRLINRNRAVLQALPQSSLQDFVVQPSTALMQMVLAIGGTHEWTARMAPALIGVASIPILFLLVKRITDPTVALVSALLLAISPWHLYLSQNARYYSALILFYLLTLLVFYIGTKPVQPKYLLLALLFLVLGTLERLFALFLVPIGIGYLILLELLAFNGNARKGIRWLILLILFLAGAYLVYDAITVLSQQAPLRLSVVKALLYFAGKQNMQPQWLLTALVNAVGVPLFCLALYGSVVQLRRKSDLGLLLTVGAWLPLFILMALTFFIRMRTWYLLIVLPCWVILGALGVQALYRHARAGYLAPITVLLAVMVALLTVDPFVEDFGYYLHQSAVPLEVVSWVSAALVVGVTLYSRLQSPTPRAARVAASNVASQTAHVTSGQTLRRQVALAGGALALFILLAHPLLRMTLYHTVQHGLRDEMRSALTMIHAEKRPGDRVLVHPTLVWLAEYYVDAPVTAMTTEGLGTGITPNQRWWIVEEFGVNTMLTPPLAEWIAANCHVAGQFDRHVEGRIWPLRLQLCE